jgi:predicted component of type VI protein secretion system
MKIRLELAHKTAKVKKVLLKADTVIGRSTECDLRIASNEVSRQHCKICLADDGVTVRDLGSSNGTFVNGYQLDPDTDYEIAPDSELSLGGIKFFVRFSESPAKAMQTDGLGSTVDLKLGLNGGAEQPDQAETALEASDEEMHFPEAKVIPEPMPMSETGTVQMTRPPDLDSVTEEPDFEISAHGDSAILEREPENLADLEYEDDELVDLELDKEPEHKPADNDQLADTQDMNTPDQAASQKKIRKQNPASSEANPQADDVAAFLNQVADDEVEIQEEESLGDFFKQFD